MPHQQLLLKIFSLYNERVGGLSVVCESDEAAGRVLGQLKATVRRNYSSPPNFGAQVVSKVLNDTVLRAQWQAEVEQMRLRILDMRHTLVEALKASLPERNLIICCNNAACSATPALVRHR